MSHGWIINDKVDCCDRCIHVLEKDGDNTREAVNASCPHTQPRQDGTSSFALYSDHFYLFLSQF
jgi:hypothetical protein